MELRSIFMGGAVSSEGLALGGPTHVDAIPRALPASKSTTLHDDNHENRLRCAAGRPDDAAPRMPNCLPEPAVRLAPLYALSLRPTPRYGTEAGSGDRNAPEISLYKFMERRSIEPSDDPLPIPAPCSACPSECDRASRPNRSSGRHR